MNYIQPRQNADARPVLWVLFVVTCSFSPAATFAQVSEIDLPEEQIEPAELRERLAAGDYVALSREKWEQLKETAREHIASKISQAQFDGTFDGESMKGTFVAKLAKSRSARGTFEFHPLSFSISNLRWDSEQPVVKGANQDGHQAILSNRQTNQLSGDWSVKGNPFGTSTQFQLQFPSSASTTFRIITDRLYTLEANNGIVSSQSNEDGTTLWTVFPGPATSTLINIFRIGPGQTASVFINEVVNVGYSRDATRMTAEFKLEVLNSPIRKLKFRLDKSFNNELLNVTYGEPGTNRSVNSLPVARTVDGNQLELAVTLPEDLLGISRTLTIDASKPAVRKGETIVPWVHPTGVGRKVRLALRKEQLNVRVSPPLTLGSLQSNGYQQTEASFGRGHEVTFQREAANAVLKVTIGEQQVVLNPVIEETIDVTKRPWESTSSIQVSPQAGQVFELTCRIRKGWDVTQVTSGSQKNPVNALISAGQDEQRILRIDFSKPILTDAERTIQVKTQRLPGQSQLELQLPIVTIPNSATHDCVVRVDHRAGSIPQLLPDSSFVRTASSVGNLAAGILELKSEVREGVELVSGILKFPDRKTTFDTTTNTTLTLDELGLREQIRIEVEPVEEAVSKVEVRFSGTNPPTEWMLNSVALNSRVVNSSAGQSLVEIELPQPLTGRFQIESDNRRHVPSDHAAIPFVPAAGEFKGQLRFTSSPNLPFEFSPHPDLQKVDQESTVDFREWTYNSIVDCGVQSIESTDGVAVARMRLTTLLGTRTDGFDHHSIVIDIDRQSSRTDLELKLSKLPADYRIKLNDSFVRQPEGDVWLIPLAPDASTNRVELTFRQPNSGSLLWSRRIPAMPELLSHAVSHFDWNVRTRDGLRIAQLPITATGPVVDFGWSRRFLGVIAPSDSVGSDVDLQSPVVPKILFVVVHEKVNMQLTCWLMLFLAMIAVVLWRRRYSRSVVIMFALATLAFVCFWPAYLPEFPGTILCGLLLGICIPTTLIRVSSNINRTQRIIDRRLATTLVLLFCCLQSNVIIAQSVHQPDRSIIVPKITGGSDVIYIPRSAVQSLQSRGRGSVVFTDVNYAATADADGRIQMGFECEVTATEFPIQIRLPFAKLNPGRCVLNGKTMDFETDGRFLVINVNSLPKRRVDDVDPKEKEIESDNNQNIETDFQTLKLKLTLRPISVVVDDDSKQFEFPLMSAMNSSYRVEFSQKYASVVAKVDGKIVAAKEDVNQLEAKLPTGKSARIYWSTNPLTQPESRTLSSWQTLLVHLHRDFSEIEIFESITGAIEPGTSFVSQIPSGLEIDRVVSQSANEIRRSIGPNGQTLIQFEFDDFAEEAEVRIYCRAIKGADSQYELPPIQLHPEAFNDGLIESSATMVVVTSDAGFLGYAVSDALTSSDRSTLPLTLQQETGLLNAETHVYELSHSDTLRFGRSKNPVSRDVQLQQSIVVGSDQISWSATAQLKSGVDDIFEHTLIVDPQIKLDSVSVQAAGADRLARWSRRNDQLTLFLSRPINDDEEIQLSGRMAYTKEKIFRLPRFEFSNTTRQASLIDLSHESDVGLEVRDRENLAPTTNTPVTTEGIYGFARYEVNAGQPQATVQTVLLKKLTANVLHELLNQPDGMTLLRTRIHSVNSDASGRMIRMRIPESMRVVRIQGAEWVEAADDRSVIILNPDRATVDSWSVDLVSRFSFEGNVDLPVVDFSGQIKIRRSWLVAPETLEPTSTLSKPSSIAELPVWAVPAETNPIYQIDSDVSWNVQKVASTVVEPTVERVSLRVDRLWRQTQGAIFGQTTLLTDKQFPPFEYQMPQGVIVVRLLANGRPIELDAIDLESTVSLEVFWQVNHASANSLVQFPFSELKADRNLLQTSGFEKAGMPPIDDPGLSHFEYGIACANRLFQLKSTVGDPNVLTTIDTMLAESADVLKAGNGNVQQRDETLAQIDELNLDASILSIPAVQTESRFFDLSSQKLKKGLTVKATQPWLLPALSIAACLLVAWLAVRAASTGRLKRVRLIESVLAITAGLVCLWLDIPPAIGCSLIVCGLLATQLKVQPAVTTKVEPIAIAPTTKQ